MSGTLEPGTVSLRNAAGGTNRLGINRGGYHGERIDIDACLGACTKAARQHHWNIEMIPASSGPELVALSRKAAGEAKCPAVYISAGIHGDEPAGPMAIRQLIEEDAWAGDLSLWICPCLNPEGFRANRRENSLGLDLNREYLEPQAEEVRAHITWLRDQPQFHLCICLHEDWEAAGFYLYELNPDRMPSGAEHVINEVGKTCPIDRSEIIEGRPAAGGIIRPDQATLRRTQWPEALFLLKHKTRHSLTLEAPSDFPLAVRVAALVVAVRTAVKHLLATNPTGAVSPPDRRKV